MKRPLTLASIALAFVVLPSASQAAFLHQGYTQVGDVDGNIGALVNWSGYGGNEVTEWRLGIVHAKADPLLSMQINSISLIAALEDENQGAQTELSLVRLGPEANFVNTNNSPGYADKFSLGMMIGGTGNWGNPSNFGALTLKEYTFGGLSSLNITLAPGQDEWFAFASGPSNSGTGIILPTSDVTGYRSYFGYRDQTPMYKLLPFDGTGSTWGVNISASPVPEPGTCLALGFGVATMLRRRRIRSDSEAREAGVSP